ncbi:MAG: hypothetical protein K0R65_1569 [Crocinitomicaceae bacterium]|jgi:hypothetical protein|nr:hypothetical protein [Crocinitomicaceae bacterium]
MEEIRNKVAESGLISLDLADFKPRQGTIKEIDIAEYLWQGLALREKDFREAVKQKDWNEYKDQNVYIHCTADAIVPTWAYMLIASQLEGVVKHYVVGSKADLEKNLIRENIAAFNPELPEYESKRYIIKGCADISSPEYAMTELMKKIQPTAKSIMYGEPCSTVPIFKRKA